MSQLYRVTTRILPAFMFVGAALTALLQVTHFPGPTVKAR